MSGTRRVSARDWARYQAMAEAMGFRRMAAAPNHDIECADRVRDWTERGYHGEMAWFARGLEKRLDLAKVMEDAASVIVLTIPYHKEPCLLAGKKLARYACGDDYHEALLDKLRRLCAAIIADYPAAKLRPYVDTGPLLERYWAQRAGLGWIGKNGCLIDRESGSYLFIACIVANLETPAGEPHLNFCGSCRACIDACPTDAIVAEGMVDSRKCISYLNIEHRGPLPDNAPDFHGWIFGCDICQEVCPWTVKFSQDTPLLAFEPRPGYHAITAEEMDDLAQEQFSAIFRKSAIKRTKLAGLKRNWRRLSQERRLASKP